MKKIVYIGILFLILVITSCSKEEIVIDKETNTPEWSEPLLLREPPVRTSNDGVITVDDSPEPLDETLTGDITDPNNDPDGKKKKH